MKTSLSKIASLVSIMLALALTLNGCAEDPAANNREDVAGGSSVDNPGNGGGGGNTNAVISEINIKNSTGYTISGIYVKPSTSTDWGNNLWGYSSLSDGQSRKITFSNSISTANGVDIRLSTGSSGDGTVFRKYKVSPSNGATVTFTVSDLNDGSDLPEITIENRSGVSFNSIYVRPSSVPESSSDWGKDYGSLSNNNDKSITISIPPSNYTVFDIQMRSSNPTNTYTKKNVTVSKGMVLTYTSADSDNPLIGLPIIVIKNNTGYTIQGIYIKLPTSTDWGSNLWGYSSLSDGQSRTFTLSQSLSANDVYDIRLSTGSSGDGITFRKYSFTVSEGMIIPFTVSDLNDGSDLPEITIENRSGVSFNSIYVRPSSVPESSSDWGKDYGSLSNNNDKSITISIPPSNYTVFDVQMRSSNPTNTYTKKNVTVSKGMVLTYTSADSDNPLIGSPIIVIKNNTGYTIQGIYIKSSDSTDWGSNLWGYSSLSDGQSRTFTVSQPLSSDIDIRLSTSSSGGTLFVKSGVTLLEGMIVDFTVGDLQ